VSTSLENAIGSTLARSSADYKVAGNAPERADDAAQHNANRAGYFSGKNSGLNALSAGCVKSRQEVR
jgi:hypothetical protein